MSGSLTASVGRNATNHPKDVGKVQLLINIHYKNNTAFRNKLKNKLVIDNDCGPNTITAIKLFQSIILNWKKPDGRVDATGKATTWKALNGNVPDSKHIVKKRTNGKYIVYSQLNYKNTLTGNSSSSSISRTGCTLTVLTMAATAIGGRNEKWPSDLLPKDLNPIQANKILKDNHAFNGGDMYIGKGANALGMKFKEYGRDSILSTDDINVIRSHLGKGYPVAAHVDYKRGSKGDHWILIIRQNADGSFAAIDPLFGGEIKLVKSTVNNARLKSKPELKINGILFGSKGNHDKNAGPITRKGQQNYIVVRFGLLSPMTEILGSCMDENINIDNKLYSGFSLATTSSLSIFDLH